MSWDFDYALNSLTLLDVADVVVLEDELYAPFDDPGVLIPGRDGVEFDEEAPFTSLVVALRLHLRWTNAAGAVTHVDGEAGHIYENLSLVKRELNKPAPVLTRTAPHIGDVRAVVKANSSPILGGQRHIYVFPLTIPGGAWQDAAESSDTGAPPTGVTTTGDRRIPDARISLSAAGTYTITDADGTVYSIIAAAGPTYPVVVDVGARTILDNGSVDASGDITFSHDTWFRLSPNHTHTVTGASSTIYWRDRWA